ncbi:MAG: LPS export ABC transporter periplasmic protein LptC [Rhizomicrobium sp.]
MTASPVPLPKVARSQVDWSVRARADLQQTERYTRFVVIAKRVLLGAAAVLLAAVLIYTLQPRQKNGADYAKFAFKNIEIIGDDLAMTSPRLTGVDESGDPYIVTAELAIQDHLNAKRAKLKNVQGDVTLKDGTWATGTAPSGFLDASRKLLTLTGRIDVYSDNGYEAHTTAALINMDTGMITGNREVTGQGTLGTFRADRFKIDRDKKLVYLYSNVRMIIYGHVMHGQAPDKTSGKKR